MVTIQTSATIHNNPIKEASSKTKQKQTKKNNKQTNKQTTTANKTNRTV